jgi:hypothetical protein
MRIGKFLVRIILWTGLLAALMHVSPVSAGPYPPAAGQPGSTAIGMDDPSLVGWATGIDVVRGPMDISNPAAGNASFGVPELALGAASGEAIDVVSLGDGGVASLTFVKPIVNGPGFDFAVFENGFGDNFLELAFVEVSSDGIHFFRFDSVSLTQTGTQVGGFDLLDPSDLDNLAGKYRQGYGTPFDLEELAGTPGLDVHHIVVVRIIDVVGSIDGNYATYDSLGNKINDPWPTAFDSSGFDLEAVGVLNAVTCGGDVNYDGDVDGNDLVRIALGLHSLALSDVSENFGRVDCNE